MYYLYHEFLQQIKQQEIQQYNLKHHQHLPQTKQPLHSTPAPPPKTNRRQRQFRPSSKPQPNQHEVPPTIQHQPHHHLINPPQKQITLGKTQPTHHQHQPLQQIQLQRPIQQTNQQQIEEYAEVKLVPCPLNCGRSFKAQAIEKHAKVCKKVFQEKRKPFQVKTTPQQAEKIKNKSTNNENGGKKSAKWKKQSEKFRNMLKMGRGQLSKEEVEEIDDRIQCPHCGRKFNEAAATRHIAVCKRKANMKK